MKQFQQDFFNKPKDIAVAEFKRRVDTFLGPNNVGTKHIEELHDLGYISLQDINRRTLRIGGNK